jgi:hypothetical protein
MNLMSIFKNIARFLLETLVATQGSVMLAVMLSPIAFSLLGAGGISFPSRGYLMIIPFFPLQCASAVIVAWLNRIFRGAKPYSYYVWVVPAIVSIVGICFVRADSIFTKFAFVMLPPFRMEQFLLALPLYTSACYSATLFAIHLSELSKNTPPKL